MTTLDSFINWVVESDLNESKTCLELFNSWIEQNNPRDVPLTDADREELENHRKMNGSVNATRGNVAAFNIAAEIFKFIEHAHNSNEPLMKHIHVEIDDAKEGTDPIVSLWACSGRANPTKRIDELLKKIKDLERHNEYLFQANKSAPSNPVFDEKKIEQIVISAKDALEANETYGWSSRGESYYTQFMKLFSIKLKELLK